MRPPVLFTVAALALSLAGSLRTPGPGGSTDPARSVDPHLTVVSDVLVGRPGPLPYTEPHLAVHPDDPDRLLAVAIVGYSRSAGRAPWDCALMRSDDGGRSWVEERLGIGRCADPWVILTGDTAWVAALGDATSVGGSRGVALLRSPDGGGSWEPLDPDVACRHPDGHRGGALKRPCDEGPPGSVGVSVDRGGCGLDRRGAEWPEGAPTVVVRVSLRSEAEPITTDPAPSRTADSGSCRYCPLFSGIS